MSIFVTARHRGLCKQDHLWEGVREPEAVAVLRLERLQLWRVGSIGQRVIKGHGRHAAIGAVGMHVERALHVSMLQAEASDSDAFHLKVPAHKAPHFT